MKSDDVKVGATYMVKIDGVDVRARVVHAGKKVPRTRQVFELEPVDPMPAKWPANAKLISRTSAGLRPDHWAGVTEPAQQATPPEDPREVSDPATPPQGNMEPGRGAPPRTVREAHPEAFAGLQFGTCGVCSRDDVLTFDKSGVGVLLTYHDDPAGVACAGGGRAPSAKADYPREAGKVVFQRLREAIPRSLCTCGHLGDGGSDSSIVPTQHAGLVGHGACEVPGCPCQKFTWTRTADLVERAVDAANEAEAEGPARALPVRIDKIVADVLAVLRLLAERDPTRAQVVLAAPLTFGQTLPSALVEFRAKGSGEVPLRAGAQPVVPELMLPEVKAALGRFRLGARPSACLTRSQQAVLPAMERAGLLQRLQGGSSSRGMVDAYELTEAGRAALAKVAQ